MQVSVGTSIMGSETDKSDYMVRFVFDIKDVQGEFKLKCTIINKVYIQAEDNEELKVILDKECIPDLLKRGRKTIKNITTEMGITPIDLLPFSKETIK